MPSLDTLVLIDEVDVICFLGGGPVHCSVQWGERPGLGFLPRGVLPHVSQELCGIGVHIEPSADLFLSCSIIR